MAKTIGLILKPGKNKKELENVKQENNVKEVKEKKDSK